MATKKYKGYSQSLREFSPAEDKKIIAMRKRGATGQEIALELACHKGPVYRRLRELGLRYNGFWKVIRAKQDEPAKKKKAPKKKEPPKKPVAAKKAAPAAKKAPTAAKKAPPKKKAA
jgi:hypothetical protein